MIFYILRYEYFTFKDVCVAYHVVVIATFHTNIVTHIQYIFNGFDDISTKHKFQRKKYSDINGII